MRRSPPSSPQRTAAHRAIWASAGPFRPSQRDRRGRRQPADSKPQACGQRRGWLDVTDELLPEDLLALDELAVILIQLRISAQHLIVEVRDSGVGRPQIPNGGLTTKAGAALRLASACTLPLG